MSMHRLRRFSLNLLLTLGLLLGGGPLIAQTAAKPAKAAPAPVFDINSASIGELKSVPGIGDAYANKIIAGRPYKNKSQLKSRNILPDAVYAKASPFLVAKQK
jgi:DNA uptake protein ComE-like DNA-binding protein